MIIVLAWLDILISFGIIIQRNSNNHALIFERFNKTINRSEPNLTAETFVNIFSSKILCLAFNRC